MLGGQLVDGNMLCSALTSKSAVSISSVDKERSSPGVDGSVVVCVDHGEIDYVGHYLVLGDGGAIRRYVAPKGLAFGIIQGRSLIGSLCAA